MEKRRPISLFSEWLLKITVIIFFFFLLLPPENYDIFSGVFWDQFSNILYFVLWIGLVILIFIPVKHTFRILCFFLLMTSAFMKILIVIYEEGFVADLSVYLLIFAVSVYYLTRIYLNRKIS